MIGTAYRYREVFFSPGVYDDGDPIPRTPGVAAHIGLSIDEYPILRNTPCGFWVYDCREGRDRFVNENHRKQFAHRTVEAACDSFIHRKRKQIRLMKSRILDAEASLTMAHTQQVEGVHKTIYR